MKQSLANKLVTNRTSRMMVGPSGKFKNAFMWETEVDINVVPLSGMLGSLWTIVGSDNNIKLAIKYLNSIYGEATKPSPIHLNKLREEMTHLIVEEKLNVERISKECDRAKRDATLRETKLLKLNRSRRVK